MRFMEAILRLCGLKAKRMKVKEFLRQTDECHDAIRKEIDDIKKLTVNHDDDWMLREKCKK